MAILKSPVQRDVIKYLDSKLVKFSIPESKNEWEENAKEVRAGVLGLLARGHKPGIFEEKPEVKWGDVLTTGAGYRIRKFLYEGYPGMWIPALLYEPDILKDKMPVVLNPNGHHAGGKAMPYKQARCINLAKRGILALSTEFIGMGELEASKNHGALAYLHLTGIEGVGVFYLAMKRALGVLLEHPNADRSRVGVTGLSGGGWQTLMLSALDERVTVSIPVAGHNPVWQRIHCKADIGDLEQLTPDLCTVADYDTLTALIAPRPLLLIYNRYDDCCFRSTKTRKSIYLPVKRLYERFYDANNIEFYENHVPGTHNYEVDNRQQMYRFISKHFGLNTPDTEISWRKEIFTERELAVGIPRNNETLHSLALQAIPEKREDFSGCKDKDVLRTRLRELIKLPDYYVNSSEQCNSLKINDTDLIEQVILHQTDAWNIPVAFSAKGVPDSAVLYLGGTGRTMEKLLKSAESNSLNIHCSILGFGEMEITNQYHMLLQAAGQRSLGIMVAQLHGVIRWLKSIYGIKRVSLFANHELRVGFVCLVYTALFPENIEAIKPVSLLTSLTDVIRRPIPLEGNEPFSTFGLLKEFDIYDLIDLVPNIPIEDAGRGILTQYCE